jgi:hypothetical protein
LSRRQADARPSRSGFCGPRHIFNASRPRSRLSPLQMSIAGFVFALYENLGTLSHSQWRSKPSRTNVRAFAVVDCDVVKRDGIRNQIERAIVQLGSWTLEVAMLDAVTGCTPAATSATNDADLMFASPACEV